MSSFICSHVSRTKYIDSDRWTRDAFDTKNKDSFGNETFNAFNRRYYKSVSSFRIGVVEICARYLLLNAKRREFRNWTVVRDEMWNVENSCTRPRALVFYLILVKVSDNWVVVSCFYYYSIPVWD